MKIRYGLVLAMVALFGVTGCASGGGGGGGGLSLAELAADAAPGEPERETDHTRAAVRAVEDAESAVDSGDEATAQTHYASALEHAELAVAEDETNPLAHRLAAVAALGLERYQEAGTHFDRATELRPIYEFEDQPVREQAWIDLYQEAAPFVSSGDYEEAAETFEDAHAIFQGRPEVMITLGQIYAQLGEHGRSIDFMDQAMAFMDSEAVLTADSATLAGWEEQAEPLPELRAQVLAADGQYEEASAAVSRAECGRSDERRLRP